jgi:hypothetical protein
VHSSLNILWGIKSKDDEMDRICNRSSENQKCKNLSLENLKRTDELEI